MDIRIQDLLNVLLGIWLFLSPWVLEYQLSVSAWNSHLAGVAVLVIAAWALSDLKSWEELSNMIIGLWLLMSPWVLEFYHHWPAALNTTATGVAVTGLAGYLTVRDWPTPITKNDRSSRTVKT